MKFQIYGGHFEGDNKKNEIRKLEEESNKPDFWNNRDNANEVINKINNLINKIGNNYIDEIENNIELLDELNQKYESISFYVIIFLKE